MKLLPVLIVDQMVASGGWAQGDPARYDRALALYLRSGFTQLPVGLHVLGREL